MRMRLRLTFAIGLALWLLATVPASSPAQTMPAADGLRPGEFTWSPELAPRGPVAVIVSLPEQRAYVYRNGVRIGLSTTSTGQPGHDTPPGIYTILQKRREHYSNLYDNAPMPFMQRLTWGGVALLAGALPGYPASHGCVRLPKAFAERLFATTGMGTVVVVADAGTSPPSVVSPGLFSPIDSTTGSARSRAPVPPEGEWFPERSPAGAFSVLLSTADRQVVVLRDAVEIGRAAVLIDNTAPAIGTRAYLLLDAPGNAAQMEARTAQRWQLLSKPDAAAISEDTLRTLFETQRIAVPEGFARAVRTALQPGATVILTDQPLQSRDASQDVLTTEADAPQASQTADPR
jgi:hypothetical protein